MLQEYIPCRFLVLKGSGGGGGKMEKERERDGFEITAGERGGEERRGEGEGRRGKGKGGKEKEKGPNGTPEGNMKWTCGNSIIVEVCGVTGVNTYVNR